MAPQTALRDTTEQLIHLAKAFEGIEGALHEGRVVEARDLERATRLALHLLSPGGYNDRERGFHPACDVVQRNAVAAGRGETEAKLRVQASAREIARDLRLRAGSLLGSPIRDPAAPVADIARLDSRYARYAGHPDIDVTTTR